MGRRLLGAVLLMALICALSWFLFERIFPDEAAPDVAAVTPRSDRGVGVGVANGDVARSAKILRLSGRVERSSADGVWFAATEGETLAGTEELRTQGDGRAVIALGNGRSLDVARNTQFSIGELSQRVAKIKLSEGRLSAAVSAKDAGVKVRIETTSGEAAAEAEEGDFSVLADGTGRLSVATTRGKATLSGGGKVIELEEGKQSSVQPGLPPSVPVDIPSSLFLKVGKPSTLLQRERQTQVTGETVPGAVVSINGVKVVSDGNGVFQATVPLRSGSNRVVVEASDPLGREQRVQLPPITVKDKVARVKGKFTWTGKNR